MGTPPYTRADYFVSFKSILPTGDAWSDNPDGVMNKTLAGLMPAYERVTVRANQLLQEVIPSSTYELLPEWEASVGLPDPCAGLSSTIEARRAQVVARVAGQGGQSIAYFVQFAANLGYAITIRQFTPRRFNGRFGGTFGGEDWAHVWKVKAPTFTIHHRQFGVSAFGEPWASWDNTVLQCELQRLAPAHTILQFAYD